VQLDLSFFFLVMVSNVQPTWLSASPTDVALSPSGLAGLFGGARKNVFGAKTPFGITGKNDKKQATYDQTGLVKLKKFGFAGGIAGGFYDISEKEVELKDGNWSVKASSTNLEAEKTDPFGLDKNLSIRIGQSKKDGETFQAKYKVSGWNILAKTNLANVKANVSGKVADVSIGADVVVDLESGKHNALVGASYLLPFSSNPHVGFTALPLANQFALGLYGQAEIPGIDKSILGVQAQSDQTVVVGGDFKMGELAFKVKAHVPQMDFSQANVEVHATQDVGVKLSAGLRLPINGAAPVYGFEVEMKK